MNIQERIIKGIVELLHKHDFLVIPGFGGFVLKAQPAFFTGSGTALLPPSKKLGFNKQLRQNDGVLLNWLSKELICDSSMALGHIDEFADYCNSILNNKRRLNIEKLGFFYLDFENNLCFEPRNDVNFLTESFGLTAVHLIENEPLITKPQEQKPKVFIDRPATLPKSAEVHPSFQGAKKILAYGAFSVFVVVLLGFLVTTFSVQGPLKASFFNKTEKAKYVPVEYPALNLSTIEPDKTVVIKTSENGALLKIEEDIHFVVKSDVLSDNESKNVSLFKSKITAKTDRFRIVFGCFSIESNAKNYAKRLKEKNYRVSITKLDDKNLYIVAMGGFQNKSEAKAELNAVKTLFPHVWIKQAP